MNDYTTKTVRVCVNNEEVVVTTTTSIGGGGGGGRNNLDEENNNGVDNMLSMEEYYKQDHNIEGELLRIREEVCVCVFGKDSVCYLVVCCFISFLLFLHSNNLICRQQCIQQWSA